LEITSYERREICIVSDGTVMNNGPREARILVYYEFTFFGGHSKVVKIVNLYLIITEFLPSLCVWVGVWGGGRCGGECVQRVVDLDNFRLKKF
jgi:hypothetical protein